MEYATRKQALELAANMIRYVAAKNQDRERDGKPPLTYMELIELSFAVGRLGPWAVDCPVCASIACVEGCPLSDVRNPWGAP